ncbi:MULTISPECIES: hypothetical protein [unclassified Saccharothrix]|uniref:hypothetical protein n=1 Tax=unclassified Saccharothrix TaxID=2593673 RepID=UPI00307FC04B
MKVFVSYLRRENSRSSLRRVARVVEGLGRPYVDDLVDHSGGDRYRAVTEAVRSADVFVGVATPGYPSTPWTRWEFGVALVRGVPRFAVLPDLTLVAAGSPEWPWSSDVEAGLAAGADPDRPPVPPARPTPLTGGDTARA